MVRLGLVLAVLALFGCQKAEAPLPLVGTALNAIIVRAYATIAKPAVDGGAFASLGETIVLASGDGAFYLVGDGAARPLDIPPPFDRGAYLADWAAAGPPRRLRITGAAMIANRLYVAHQAWNRAAHCFTMRVSVISLAPGPLPASAGDWSVIFETSPCLTAENEFDDAETGGRLVLAPDGDLLLTVGDHGFSGLDGSAPLAQSSGDYGKILKIAPDGSAHAILTAGHRNPQGIAIASDGRIWESEHGPQGGDELNLVKPGLNYGWPLVTYGTEYGSTAWPLNPEGRDHGAYEKPAFVFIPSGGVCPLIEVKGREFPNWRGDLLIGTLRTMSLLRARLDGDRVMYVEPIPVGERVRDLAQTPDGRILIWADAAAQILEVRRSRREEAFDRFCAGCHAPAFGTPPGPPLTGVLGRPVASVPGFAYSDALKAAGGRWTDDRLKAFLADPEAFAPGTTMRLSKLDDEVLAEILSAFKAK
jgi:cytochrome c2